MATEADDDLSDTGSVFFFCTLNKLSFNKLDSFGIQVSGY